MLEKCFTTPKIDFCATEKMSSHKPFSQDVVFQWKLSKSDTAPNVAGCVSAVASVVVAPAAEMTERSVANSRKVTNLNIFCMNLAGIASADFHTRPI